MSKKPESSSEEIEIMRKLRGVTNTIFGIIYKEREL